MNSKRPRHFAAEIAAMPTREQRREALTQVPAPWRELVRLHVAIYFERRKA